MREHGLGGSRHVLVGVGPGWQTGRIAVEEVADGYMDGAARRLLVTPLVDAELLRLERPQQLLRDGLDALDVGLVQVRLLQQVEDQVDGLLFAGRLCVLRLQFLDALAQ